jgi:hypothetical protein
LSWPGSCDVAAKGRDPAAGGGGDGVEDEHERAGGDRELVGLSGERQPGCARCVAGDTGNEEEQVLDQQDPGADADQGSDLVANEGTDAEPDGGLRS